MRVFRSRSVWVRGGALLLLLAATAVVVVAVAAVCAFPHGYGGAQSEGACTLARKATEWARLTTGTAKDLLLFIPAYVIWCLVLVVVTSRSAERGRWHGGLASDGVAFVLVIAAAVADIGETLLFRSTLHRLQSGRACSSLTTQTSITLGFTDAKFAALLAVTLVVCYRALRPVSER